MTSIKSKTYVIAESETDNDSSCQEIESDLDSNVDLHLNLRGLHNSQQNKRSFDEITSSDKSKKSESSEKIDKWTEDMHDFYDQVDPNKVNITIEDILKDMPDDPEAWKVRKPHATPSRYTPSRYFQGTVAKIA